MFVTLCLKTDIHPKICIFETLYDYIVSLLRMIKKKYTY